MKNACFCAKGGGGLENAFSLDAKEETERRGHAPIKKVSLSGLTRKFCFRRCSLHTTGFEVRLEDESHADDSKHLEVERSFAAP